MRGSDAVDAAVLDALTRAGRPLRAASAEALANHLEITPEQLGASLQRLVQRGQIRASKRMLAWEVVT